MHSVLVGHGYTIYYYVVLDSDLLPVPVDAIYVLYNKICGYVATHSIMRQYIVLHKREKPMSTIAIYTPHRTR